MKTNFSLSRNACTTDRQKRNKSGNFQNLKIRYHADNCYNFHTPSEPWRSPWIVYGTRRENEKWKSRFDKQRCRRWPPQYNYVPWRNGNPKLLTQTSSEWSGAECFSRCGVTLLRGAGWGAEGYTEERFSGDTRPRARRIPHVFLSERRMILASAASSILSTWSITKIFSSHIEFQPRSNGRSESFPRRFSNYSIFFFPSTLVSSFRIAYYRSVRELHRISSNGNSRASVEEKSRRKVCAERTSSRNAGWSVCATCGLSRAHAGKSGQACKRFTASREPSRLNLLHR